MSWTDDILNVTTRAAVDNLPQPLLFSYVRDWVCLTVDNKADAGAWEHALDRRDECRAFIDGWPVVEGTIDAARVRVTQIGRIDARQEMGA